MDYTVKRGGQSRNAIMAKLFIDDSLTPEEKASTIKALVNSVLMGDYSLVNNSPEVRRN